jgi:hypothetical protein
MSARVNTVNLRFKVRGQQPNGPGRFGDGVIGATAFGGETIYVISSNGQVIKERRTFRKRQNAQFWRAEIVRLSNDAILIIYEV